MKNEPEKYVSNNEYTKAFQKKTVKAALIVTGATVAVSIVLILLGLNTNFLYHTDIFKVKAAETVPIHAEKRAFSGNEYEFELESYINDDGNISIILNAEANETAMNRLSSDNFKLICYDNIGDKREEVISTLGYNKESSDVSPNRQSCRFELTFARYSESEKALDDLFCLRIITESSDGIISILCNYNTKS
ncbi:MAG: hypothetical protein ACI4J5_04070 [Oscillospiraceae bacterium]